MVPDQEGENGACKEEEASIQLVIKIYFTFLKFY